MLPVDYEEERRQTLLRNANLAVSLLLAFVFTFAAIEWQRRPAMRPWLVLCDILYVLVCGSGLWIGRTWPRHSVTVAVLGINACAGIMQLYTALGGGSLELCVVGTTILLGGVVALLPLGVRHQLYASVVTVVGYPLMLAFGAQRYLDPWYSFGATLACVATMALGADTVDRYRRRFLEQHAEQARLAAANERLVDEARRAHAGKSEFLATVAHELRNPLSAIIGYSDLLREGAFTEPGERDNALCRIHAQAIDMFDMMQNLLDADKADSGTLRLDYTEVEVASFLQRLRDELPPGWDKPGVRLEWGDAPAAILVTDARKLKAILRNLIHNAIKYTSTGQVVVAAAEHVDGVEFVVADTGEGIPAADLPHIFDRFRQSANESRSGGVGLGLHIARRFVEALGGGIQVESEVGKGSRFALRLPLRPR
jgi:signal transduction histidine kinase